ncbi:CCA tRNA nucleotidyltransferase [Gemmobacter aquarius]|uniref:CCA tRNA nucleotidyltransferase n=1 Tax=Paragemmobacter aquarius TaxID=2169400 RepID=A0A2S0UQI2_9RHOB|nr:CCA tRNA nucleotidyltransferase [Gemmobacter aquarius]AWB50074.1 CCA tRNA nucleotidyltransferase [Gemmobacter aquarius]
MMPWVQDADAQAVCAALTEAGYRALFVGGCVRNALLGEPVSDYDIATDATPERVTNLAEKAGLKVVPTGIEHGTVTVVSGGKPHEVTTFRRDVETDGRHAVVAFSTDVAEDAARRDFTMNALYATAAGEVIDPLGGLPDLMARRVRFVGDAAQRIAEDYLRVLRFFRFHAWYGDAAEGIDAEGLAACAAAVDGLAGLSRERVGAELRKLVSAPDPAPAVASMARAGVLGAVLPGADDRALALLVHLEAGRVPRWKARLAVLGGNSDDLRLSRAEARDVAALREAAGSVHSAAGLGYLLGADLGADAVLVRAALMEQALPDAWQPEVARGAAAVLPVTAADLMDQVQGPALGARLREIENRWLAADLRAGRESLLG